MEREERGAPWRGLGTLSLRYDTHSGGWTAGGGPCREGRGGLFPKVVVGVKGRFPEAVPPLARPRAVPEGYRQCVGGRYTNKRCTPRLCDHYT